LYPIKEQLVTGLQQGKEFELMRQQQRDFAISDCRIRFAIAVLLFIYPLTSHSAAWADGFQQIRTFDPNKGFVAGNGPQSTTGSQPYSTPPGWTTQQTAVQGRSGQNGVASSASTTARNEEDDESRESKHHKHHHKFLIFGHHEDDAPTNDSAAASDDVAPTGPVERTTTIQQNNKLYVPPSPTYFQEPVESASMPVVVPRTASPVVPPEPRQRPTLPAVDQNARLPLVQTAGAKPALAWRARAWKLANESDDASTAMKHPSKILNCSPDEALNAAANCCRAKGAQIVGESLPAGQLGVRFTDSSNNRSFIIFIVKSLGNGRTLLKACADSDRVQKIALSNDLIQQAAAIIDGKGLL
jgi:hypothetical protein